MGKQKVLYNKDFSNVDEVFDKMLELGFFMNPEHRDERKAEALTRHETHYSNGVVELRIFRGIFGSFYMTNYMGVANPAIDELFGVATKSVIK